MMKKNIFFLSVLIAGVALAPAMAEVTIFELENDYVMGYNFAANDIAQTTRIGFNLPLSKSFNIGLVYQQAGTNIAAGSYMIFNYKIVDKVKAGIMFGRAGGNPSAGLQFGYDMLINNVKELVTTLRVKLEYHIPNITGAVITNGTLGITLGVGLGL